MARNRKKRVTNVVSGALGVLGDAKNANVDVEGQLLPSEAVKGSVREPEESPTMEKPSNTKQEEPQGQESVTDKDAQAIGRCAEPGSPAEWPAEDGQLTSTHLPATDEGESGENESSHNEEENGAEDLVSSGDPSESHVTHEETSSSHPSGSDAGTSRQGSVAFDIPSQHQSDRQEEIQGEATGAHIIRMANDFWADTTKYLKISLTMAGTLVSALLSLVLKILASVFWKLLPLLMASAMFIGFVVASINIIVNIQGAFYTGLVHYTTIGVCKAAFHVPLRDKICSAYDAQAKTIITRTIMPNLTDSYPNFEELAEGIFLSKRHTFALSDIGSTVRSLRYRVEESSLEAKVKERLRVYFTKHINLNHEARRSTSRLLAVLGHTIESVLIQTMFTSNDLDRLRKDKEMLEEKYKKSLMTAYCEQAIEWLTKHKIVYLPAGMFPFPLIPYWKTPDYRAALHFRNDISDISRQLQKSINATKETAVVYNAIVDVVDEIITKLATVNSVAVSEKAVIVESRGIWKSMLSRIGITMTDVKGSDDQLAVLASMSDAFRSAVKFYEDSQHMLETIVINYDGMVLYLDEQLAKKALEHALQGQTAPTSIFRDLEITVKQMEARAKTLQKIENEWKEENERYRAHVFGPGWKGSTCREEGSTFSDVAAGGCV
ncbi:MAG: hypothetical protein Q9163_001573 [Psora crenata]